MPNDRPNILFCFPDQHRPDFVAGDDDLPVRTPYLDELAARGVRFTRAHCASPELEPIGVTTVFGNVLARARQAQTILQLAGRDDVPVAAGCGVPMSPRVTYLEPDLAGGQASLEKKAQPLLNDVRPSQDGTALPATAPTATRCLQNRRRAAARTTSAWE